MGTPRDKNRSQKAKHTTHTRNRASIHRLDDSSESSNIRVLPLRGADGAPRTRINIGRVIGVMLVIYFIIWSVLPITQRMEQRREMQKLNTQLGQIKKQNDELRETVEYLKSDEYVEQQARSLGLSKPDEEVIVVIPQKKTTPTTIKKPVDIKEAELSRMSFWERISSAFERVF